VLRIYNTVVNTCRICLTRGYRFSSLRSVNKGFEAFRAWRWLVAGILGVLVGACATVVVAPSPQEVVGARAKARWELMMKGDMSGAYEYLSPSSKEVLPKALYERRGGARYWRSFALQKVECDPDTCKVHLELTYDLSVDVRNLKREIVETWILDGGVWWLVEGR
jgi:hypothetical protein